MRKRFVGVRHAVRVFLLLDRISAVVCRVENFSRQTIGHRLLTTAACVRDDPANCQGAAPLLVYFNRHLIVEPPTRRDFTSTVGFTLSIARLKTFKGSSPVLSPTCRIAS